MHWRLSVSLTLVQFLWFGLALSSNEITGVGSEANNLFINAFPRNIYHIFKGSWQFINESDSRNVGFEKQEGAIWFSLSNGKFSSEFDLVQGEAVIRDGIYSTDKNMKFLLQGAYFFQQGTLLLLALPTNPYVEEIAPTAFFSTLSNMTAAQALIAVEKIIISETSSYNGTTPNLCPFRFVLQMRPERPLSLSDKIAMSKPDLIAAEPTVNVTLGGHLFSRCDVMMSITAESVQISDYSSKWIKYVAMVLLSSFVQIFVLRRQMEYTRTQAYASKVSLLTVGAQAVLDVYLCLIHLVAGILIEQMFTAFVTAAFFQFVTFLLFELRYLMVILKARRRQTFSEEEITRREFSLFFLRFYTFVVGAFILIYYMSYLLYIFIFIMHSFWVPEIVYNAQKCSRRPVLWQYVIGMSVTRLTIPLYFYGCPHNLLMVEPSFLMCFLLTAYMAAQIFVMYLQDKVTKRFLALKHPMSEVQRYLHEVKVEAAELEKKT